MQTSFNEFKNESISKPQLKYPVEKCLDFNRFHYEMDKQGLDLTDIPIQPYGNKNVSRKSGNFYELLNTMDPIFPELTSWKLYDEKQRKENKRFGIPHTPYRYSEREAIYELPIKYDSSNDYANWVEKRVKFFDNMKIMAKLRGKKQTEEDEKMYDDHVDFGPKSYDWYNIVLDKLYELYPQHYKNGKIKIWHNDDDFDEGKQMWDYPYDKAYFLSDLEKWIEDTFNIDTTGLYEWILDNQYIERRWWNRVWYYDIANETFRKQKATENIKQINELLKQMFKTESMPIYVDYYKEYSDGTM